jgi:hypothetical protein
MSYKTYPDYLRSPQFQIVKKMAVDRSGGRCEKCKIKSATHVHHIKYPPWGTYEKDASGVIALCHDCHYEIHREEIERRGK